MSTPAASSAKAFASQSDLADKKTSFEQLSAHCWAYTAEETPTPGSSLGTNSSWSAMPPPRRRWLAS